VAQQVRNERKGCHMNNQTASEKIGSFIASTRPALASDEVIHQAARAFVDIFGVALAGRNEPASRIILDYVTSSRCDGPATIWATGQRTRPEDATLVNVVMGHVLDYDDVTNLIRYGHQTLMILPALIALGQAQGATGGQISAAFAAGFEVVAKLPQDMVLEHYQRGWHVTSTFGVIAAAAACAQLLRLDATRAAAAVGIAVAHASGVLRSFGTMSKPIQPANGAAAAIRCARLAAAGFTAPRDSMEGPLGFVDVYGKGYDLHDGYDKLGEEPIELLRSGVGVKKYPCCYGGHHAIQAALDLLAEHPVRPADIERVWVTVQPTGLVAMPHNRPQTGLEGKFSMPYVVATALLDRAVRLQSFTDAAVRRPEIQALLQKIEVREEDEGGPLPRRAVVEVQVIGGQRFAVRVEHLRGARELPLEDCELEEKLRDCISFSGLTIDVDRFLAMVWDWRDRPVGEIVGNILIPRA
jgi:2-methylcitrate dehydratase PrpD